MTFSSSTIGRYTKRWLVAVGVFELIIAAAFLLAGLAIDEVALGFLLTALILGVTGIALIAFGLRAGRSADQADRILSTGIAGTARIVGLTQTGMSLNDNPQVALDLEVTLPGRPPYQASRKEFVPIILVGRLTSGAPLAVKIDPADPQQVVIDWGAPASAAMPAGALGLADVPTAPDETLGQVQAALAASGMPAAATFATPAQGQVSIEQLRAHVRANGIPGIAKIHKLADTGEVVGDERLFTMEATVHVTGQLPRKTDATAAMVPIAHAGKVAVGVTVPVLVAPENPELVLFEWDRI